METIEARIEQAVPSKSGRALRIKFQGREDWFNAYRDCGIDKAVGSLVVVEAEKDEKFGWGIKAWRAMANQGTDTKAPSVGGGVSPWFMPFVSNTVAHAIAAGFIKEPAQIGAWAKAAQQTAIALEDDVPV